MPQYDSIEEFFRKKNKADSIYGVAKQVWDLQKDRNFLEGELSYLISTLSLEHNRENLRRGDGLEQLFELVNNISEKIKNYNQKGE